MLVSPYFVEVVEFEETACEKNKNETNTIYITRKKGRKASGSGPCCLFGHSTVVL